MPLPSEILNNLVNTLTYEGREKDAIESQEKIEIYKILDEIVEDTNKLKELVTELYIKGMLKGMDATMTVNLFKTRER